MDMTTKSIVAVMALALFASANAQTGTTTSKDKSDPPQVPELLRSHYDACLLTANSSTWSALGLNSDQMTRIAEVQTRYRTYVNPPKPAVEEKKSKKKSKATKADNAELNKEHLDKSVVNDADPKQTDAATLPPSTLEAPTGNTSLESEAMGAQALSYDEELRGILTPEQWAIWDKRCAETSMK